MAEFNKLVRDRIPEIIQANGESATYHILGDAAFKKALLDKLVEEAIELRDSGGSVEERVDVAQVLRAIDASFGIDADELERMRQDKEIVRGGFDARIFLERTD